MLKLKMERKMNKEKLDNLFVKVYKLTNNENGLNYRVIAREKRFGKIVHDKMFFTEDGYKNFINKLRGGLYDLYEPIDAEYRELMIKLKNAKNDRERDILLEKVYPIYTGGCEGLLIKHKANGIRVIEYDFLDKIRYDEVDVPEWPEGMDIMEYEEIYNIYEKEYGIAEYTIIAIIKDKFKNVDYTKLDNAIVRFKHKLYRH